ncbi:PREDICTED: uncharacterized protein LOC104599938 [Nelumbo nucifera]|uniref:Uncharacterized protein LOC104599938 n=1 Tax=Nelumbo nucifera TaxID=4432 RepID=A0A1U8AGD8_NELNU|nr:PREDICTED: uncharacterized protein LOC104599938 [Nelumbo nucifera]
MLSLFHGHGPLSGCLRGTAAGLVITQDLSPAAGGSVADEIVRRWRNITAIINSKGQAFHGRRLCFREAKKKEDLPALCCRLPEEDFTGDAFSLRRLERIAEQGFGGLIWVETGEW